MSDQPEILTAALKEEADLVRQLEASPTFRKLQLIRKVLAEYGFVRSDAKPAAPRQQRPAATKRHGRAGAKARSAIDETADAAEAVIRAAGRPMQRGELYTALQGRGVAIKGKDPRNVMTTRLYHSKRFVNIEGRGFAMPDVDYSRSESKTAGEDQSPAASSNGGRASHPAGLFSATEGR